MQKRSFQSKFNTAAVDLTEWGPRVLSLGLATVYLFSLCIHFAHVGESHHSHENDIEQCHDHASVDPCHQAIYHVSLSACDHDVHLFEPVPSCEVCDLLLTKARDHQQNQADPITIAIRSIVVPGELPCPVVSAAGSSMLRAPPRA